jgi:hypothetical protein
VETSELIESFHLDLENVERKGDNTVKVLALKILFGVAITNAYHAVTWSF